MRAGVVTLVLPFIFVAPLVVIALWPELEFNLGAPPHDPLPRWASMVSLKVGPLDIFEFSLGRLSATWERSSTPFDPLRPRGWRHYDGSAHWVTGNSEQWYIDWSGNHHDLRLTYWK